LGWKKEDIMLVTNFPYEYNGVKSLVIGDENYCDYRWTATKIFAIDYLIKNNLIDGLVWYHDFDCYQLSPFTDIENDVGDADIALTNYGRMPRLASPSMFFKKTAKDFFEWVKKEVVDTKCNEEVAIMRAVALNKFNFRHLDITYALHRHNFNHVYMRAKKPIMAAHFHATPDKYDIFVKGQNKMNMVVIPDGLIKIFNQHGFTG
jgi:hypothetical protein